MILTPLQKLPNNRGDLGKIIVATGFEWLPKVQKIAQSGHTADKGPPYLLLKSALYNQNPVIRDKSDKHSKISNYNVILV